MDHIAIMRKSWGLIPKIVSGEKTIESRWYKTRRTPWDKITKGDFVYFKNSGGPITAKAKVAKVIQCNFSRPKQANRKKDSRSFAVAPCQCSATLTHKDVLRKYGKKLGIGNIDKFYEEVKNTRYCILIFLKKSERVKPFDIDKTGFGAMSAWISTKTISSIQNRLCV